MHTLAFWHLLVYTKWTIFEHNETQLWALNAHFKLWSPRVALSSLCYVSWLKIKLHTHRPKQTLKLKLPQAYVTISQLNVTFQVVYFSWTSLWVSSIFVVNSVPNRSKSIFRRLRSWNLSSKSFIRKQLEILKIMAPL